MSRSRQKNETTASTVPVCIAASKESPNRSWSNPKKYYARSKRLELETGRNAVSHRTILKNIASRSSSSQAPFVPFTDLARTIGYQPSAFGQFSGIRPTLIGKTAILLLTAKPG
jgi:hypothetical protein